MTGPTEKIGPILNGSERRRGIILALTALVLIIVVILAVAIHQTSEKEVLTQFKDQQQLHARNIASHIRSHLWNLSSGLRILSSLVSLRYDRPKEWMDDVRSSSRDLRGNHVKRISICDETGIVIYSTEQGQRGLKLASQDSFAWAKKGENRGKVFVSLVPEASQGSFQCLLVTPLYRESGSKEIKADSGFLGVVAFTVSVDELLAERLDVEVKEVKKDMHHVWIMREDGLLLFHSEHPEMVRRSIQQALQQKNLDCKGCHVSFKYVETILKEKTGTVDYRLKGFPRKLAAFDPMEFENASWRVTVNAPYDEVRAFVGRSLRGHLILLGIVVFALAGSSILIYRDSSLRVKAEEAFKHWEEKQALLERVERSERDYRAIVETAHDLIWTLDSQGNFTFINPNGERVSGYRSSELIGQNIEPLIHPEDFARVEEVFLDNMRGSQRSFETRFFARDGHLLFLSVNSVPLYENGIVRGLISIGRDVTEARHAEEALRESEKQLRSLSSRLLKAQEAERWRISSELHDELGQALSVMKLQIGQIERKLKSDQDDLRENCRVFLDYLRQTIENVRRLSRDLTPSILKDLGLPAAIRWLVKESSKHYDVEISLRMPDIHPAYSRDEQILIYRILQETLTNIGKHAQARKVSVVIERRTSHHLYRVEDDGKGFDMRKTVLGTPGERGLGLTTIKERARMLGGSLDLWSEEGKGTRITLMVPVKGEGRD